MFRWCWKASVDTPWRKHPADRYPSAAALADDLRRFLKDEPIRWPQESFRGRLKRWWRREPILIAHWVAIAAVLVISWTHKWLMDTDLAYVLRHTFTLVVWAVLESVPAEDYESAALAREGLHRLGSSGCFAVHVRSERRDGAS